MAEIVAGAERFVLTSHIRPDADALGSELAMAGFLERLGKSVQIVNPSETPHTLAFLDPNGRVRKVGDDAIEGDIRDTDVHIVLDTSAWKQLGEVGPLFRESKGVKVVIDHHVSSDDLGAIEFKNTSAEATGGMLFRMAEALDWPLDADIARNLFCAIATDTGWFRFPSTTSDTYRAIATLIEAGAAPHLLYRDLYENSSLARLKLTGIVLGRAEVACDGRLAYTSVESRDFEETGAHPVDTENLVNECLKIATAECAFIAVEQWNRQIKVSFRSRDRVDVAKIAEVFGGGGHQKASGATLEGPLSTAIESLRSTIVEALAKLPAPPGTVVPASSI